MGPDARRHPRYEVKLRVRYTNAQQFVQDYVENLSAGGLFIAGAQDVELLSESDVELQLPGQGEWRVRARAVYRLDADAAQKAGRRAGVGYQIIESPAGFQDALLGYLLRLGRRRDHSVMAGGIDGEQLLTESGYRVVPLPSADGFARRIAATSDTILLAIVVSPTVAEVYRAAAQAAGVEDRLHVVANADQIVELIARLDSLI